MGEGRGSLRFSRQSYLSAAGVNYFYLSCRDHDIRSESNLSLSIYKYSPGMILDDFF